MKNAEIIRQLNLEQKCALLSGETVFTTRGYKNAGIPSITLSDGPNGVRKQAGCGGPSGPEPQRPRNLLPDGGHRGLQLGPRPGRAARPGHGGGGRRAGGIRPAGAGPKHQAQPAVRAQLRVFLGGPLPLRQAGRRPMCAASSPTASPPAPSTSPSTARSCAAWRRTPWWTSAPCASST